MFGKQYWSELYIRHRWRILVIQAVVFFLLGVVLTWILASLISPQTSKVPTDAAIGADTNAVESESETQWWTCAMHPQIRQPKPGKCPICQMELVPVTQSSGGLRSLTIKPAVKELMQIQTLPVERKYVTADIRMVGKVDYDETRLAYITAWVSGRLDRLYVDYTGVTVNRGDHMVYIFSEELYAAQEELIQAIRLQRELPSRPGQIDLVASSKEKLRLLGLTEEQIQEIEQRNRPEEHITIYSPASGIVIEKLKQQGERVRTGDRIYTVADLSQVWIKLDAYESDLAWLKYGQRVTFTTEAYPGEQFEGRIAFIDPTLDKQTRTAKVRVNVPNPDGRLKPDMFVRAQVHAKVAVGGKVLSEDLAGKWVSPMHPEIIKDEPGNCDVCGMPLVRAETLGYVVADTGPENKPLVIPQTAALVTGTRAIVYVEDPHAKEPTYVGREILLGPRAGDYYIVRNGLAEGELVVTNGNFKIDSALQLQAKPTMMTPQGGGGGGHDHAGHDPTAENSDQTAMQTPTLDLPQDFVNQLHQLIAVADAVKAAMETNDLADIRAAFASLGRQLAYIDDAALAEHAAMQWKEFEMLLSNDAVEGSEANQLSVARNAFRLLEEHIARLKERFQLSHDHPMPKTEALVTTDKFRTHMSDLWRAYQQLQSALAADDASSAAQAITALQSATSSMDNVDLEEPALGRWQTERAALDTILQQLAQAEDLAAARSSFALLSEQLLVLIKTFGVAGSEPIFELHCPMAFDGRGAVWMQPDDQPRNPYYGATMLECADRIRPVHLPVRPAPTSKEDHQHVP